ncbi:MAG: PilZ domain-containing protein [Solirubrobacteraceae bacterium]
MRRLKHDQRVDIHLDSEDHAVGCRVAAVQGSVATLTLVTEVPAEVFEKFTPGELGYLLFEHRGAMTALKGIATASPADPTELAFVVIDGVQLPERRAAQRFQVGALARISPSAGAEEADGVEAAAANVSVSGVLIERPAGLAEGPGFRLELVLEDDATPIRCAASVVRETPTHIALKFTDIADADRIRLAGMIRHRALAA